MRTRLATLAVAALVLTSCGSPRGVQAKHGNASAAPPTPVENCRVEAMNILYQVPDAMREGFSEGINLDSLQVDYGLESVTYMTAETGQMTLINAIQTQGNPEDQLKRIAPAIKRACEGDGFVELPVAEGEFVNPYDPRLDIPQDDVSQEPGEDGCFDPETC